MVRFFIIADRVKKMFLTFSLNREIFSVFKIFVAIRLSVIKISAKSLKNDYTKIESY